MHTVGGSPGVLAGGRKGQPLRSPHQGFPPPHSVPWPTEAPAPLQTVRVTQEDKHSGAQTRGLSSPHHAGGGQVGRAVGGDWPAPTCQGCPSAPMLTVPEARTPARPVPDVHPSRGHPKAAEIPCPQPVPSLGQALSTQIPPCSLLLIRHAFMHPQSLSCV